MRVALCQINPTIGDIDTNIKKIVEAVTQAEKQNAQLAIFPELVVSGYPPLDLLERPSFINACVEAETRILEQLSPHTTIVFGNLALRPDASPGRRLENVAVVATREGVKMRIAKTLLPTYDVFDEARYFEARVPNAPTTFELHGKTIGVSLCEDIWNDAILWQDASLQTQAGTPQTYAEDPIEAIGQKADVLINLSASPWNIGKLSLRERIITHAAKRHNLAVVYVNAVGANDGLVFDGHSLVSDPSGRLKLRLPGWEPCVDCIDLHSFEETRLASVASDTQEILNALTLGVRDYFAKTGIKKAVIGLSGGIDSAVTCAIAVRALGANMVVGVGMPSQFSSDHSVEDARALANTLGIEFHLVPISHSVAALESAVAPVFLDRPRDVTEENLQSRVRGLILMAIANKFNAVVLGTGNKSEAAMGYATLYGDTIGALSVLADLYKNQVYDVARAINQNNNVIPIRTITKPPSAELRPNQKDSDTLPDYTILDAVLELFIEQHLGIPDIAQRVGVPIDVVRDIVQKVYSNEFKRKQLPPTIRICRKAWLGRVYPIAQRFRA